MDALTRGSTRTDSDSPETMNQHTIRSIARELKLSRSTVSDALRGSPKVKVETAQLVREYARSVGYRSNPLTSALMSEMRRSRNGSFRGMLAAIVRDEPSRPAHAIAHFRELLRGATLRAAELGFKLERFSLGGEGVPLRRLGTILDSRGIKGVILLPSWEDPDYSELDWSRFAGIYTDYFIQSPPLHSICTDHHRSMTLALNRLKVLGYTRPGLVLQLHQDERLQHRWEAAFLAFQKHYLTGNVVPPLVQANLTEKAFCAWFKRHKPDVVIGHGNETPQWMAGCGAQVPHTHGFFSLNILTQDSPCAGLDQRPRLLGAQAADLVIGKLQQDEIGIPENATLTTIPGLWTDGPTLRSFGNR